MKFASTKIPGVVLIEPAVHRDHRGFFLESYHAKKFAEGGIDARFVQDNHSQSKKGTLRGLHFQWTKPQGKLVRVLRGEIYDVVVDIRPASPTFKQWLAVTLSSADFKMLYVPPKLAHGFLVLSEEAEVEYKCTDFYDPKDEGGLLWNDPEIKVDWPDKNPLLSPKDQVNPLLKDILPKLSK
jgi:dTDP-4-dehydrorhamnose 3,5-epimerase